MIHSLKAAVGIGDKHAEGLIRCRKRWFKHNGLDNKIGPDIFCLCFGCENIHAKRVIVEPAVLPRDYRACGRGAGTVKNNAGMGGVRQVEMWKLGCPENSIILYANGKGCPPVRNCRPCIRKEYACGQYDPTAVVSRKLRLNVPVSFNIKQLVESGGEKKN